MGSPPTHSCPQIVALRHAQRVKDGAKYPSLEAFSDLYKNQGDVGSYLCAAPQEALQYILDDFQLAFNLVDKTADGLALLVACLCQAAASELTGPPPLRILTQAATLWSP